MMMASTITTIPTKTSVERKPRDGYRFTIDIGTVNAWQFDLGTEEFEEFLRQVTRAHGPVRESCMTTPEPATKPAQTNAPQPPPNGTDHPDYYGWHPVAECIQISQRVDAGVGADEVLSQVGQHRLKGQQVVGVVVDKENVDLDVAVRHRRRNQLHRGLH